MSGNPIQKTSALPTNLPAGAKAFQAAVDDLLTQDIWRDILSAQVQKAKDGDRSAAKFLLEYAGGVISMRGATFVQENHQHDHYHDAETPRLTDQAKAAGQQRRASGDIPDRSDVFRHGWLLLKHRPLMVCPICKGRGGDMGVGEESEWCECSTCYPHYDELEGHGMRWAVGRVPLRTWLRAKVSLRFGFWRAEYLRDIARCSLGFHRVITEDPWNPSYPELEKYDLCCCCYSMFPADSSWWQRVLAKWPSFDITGNDGSIYIRRHKLLESRWGNVYLHDIRRGDADRCLHDHPWRFVTLILAGGYGEVLRGGATRWRPPGTFLSRAANFSHRVTLPPGRRAWSLVITGPRVRAWGFRTLFGWRRFVKGQDSPICESTPADLSTAGEHGK